MIRLHEDDDDEVDNFFLLILVFLASRCRCFHHGQQGLDDIVVVVNCSRSRNSSRMLMKLIDQGRLEVADVIDNIIDDFHLGDFAILGHVGHQFS